MPLRLRCQVALSSLPALDTAIDSLSARLSQTVRVDPNTEVALRKGRRESSWCPWPRQDVELYVPLASSRGCGVALRRDGDTASVTVVQRDLGTWMDWKLSVHLAALLTGAGGIATDLEAAQRIPADQLAPRFVHDDRRYRRLREAATERVRRLATDEGRIVRFPGPQGTAAVGPRTWRRIEAEGPPEELPSRLVDRLQDSLDARGYEHYHPANLMVLDGRGGREVVASLLAAGAATLLRDPQYLIIGEDLERDGGTPLWLLPFEELERAFPGIPRWLDEVTCAIPAIERARWPQHLERARPLMVRLDTLLDDHDDPDGSDASRWRGYLPSEHAAELEQGAREAAASTPGRGPWWKLW